MSQATDHWRKDMGRCYLNNYGECLAKIPAACLCAQMIVTKAITIEDLCYRQKPKDETEP